MLSYDRRQRLRVDLGDFDGNTRYAEYDNFTVESAQAKYKLSSLGTYTGTQVSFFRNDTRNICDVQGLF